MNVVCPHVRASLLLVVIHFAFIFAVCVYICLCLNILQTIALFICAFCHAVFSYDEIRSVN